MIFDRIKQRGVQLSEIKKMRDEALKIQRELASEKVEISEGDIKVVISGDQKIQALEVNGENQSRLLEVLNKAIKRSQEVAARKVQTMSGGFSGLLGR